MMSTEERSHSSPLERMASALSLTVEQAAALIPNVKALYDALVRNQFILPPQKDGLVTKKFMLGILDEQYWCLKSDEVRTLKVCADPPSKKALAAILSDRMTNMADIDAVMQRRFLETALLIRQKPPCTDWMIKVLSQVDPNNHLFDKNYVKPRENPRQAAPIMIPNPNGFFDNLPLPKGKRGKRIMSFIDPATKERLRQERL